MGTQPSATSATLLDFARAALTSWPVHSAEQTRLRTAYVEHLDEHPDALWRDGPPAHLTASAHVLDAARERVLLTHHRKGGFWVQCGGHMELEDRTLAGAALREASEESGIEGLHVLGPADLHRHRLSAAFQPCREHLDASYVVVAPSGARPSVSDESLDVAWWPLKQLPETVVPDLPGRLAALLASGLTHG